MNINGEGLFQMVYFKCVSSSLSNTQIVNDNLW
jgi:hypothetical protein